MRKPPAVRRDVDDQPPRRDAPATLQGMMQWPLRMFDRMQGALGGVLDDGARDRVRDLLQEGVSVSTAYSGVGAPEIALSLAFKGALDSGWAPSQAAGFSFTQAVDIKQHAQTILLDHSEPSNHVFADLNDRLPRRLREVLDGLESVEVDADDDLMNRTAAFEDMINVLIQMEPDLFKNHPKAFCAKHSRSCCFSETASAKLRVHIAGLTCKDFSRRKRGRKFQFGTSGRPMLIWAFERRHSKEDIILVENTQDFDMALLERVLGELYEMFTFVAGPEDLGWWSSRHRRFIVMVLKSDEIKSCATPDQFLKIFGALRPEDADCPRGDMFFAAPADYLDKLKKDKCMRRMGSEAFADTRWWSDIVAPAQSTRLALYQRVLLDKVFGNGVAQGMIDVGGDPAKVCKTVCKQRNLRVVCDLDQHPNFCGMQTKGALPTLISHGSLYSFRMQRELSGMEWFAAQGFPVWDLGPYPMPWGDAVWQLPEHKLKDLAGNSMHLEVMASLIFWVLATTVRMPLEQALSSLEPQPESPEPEASEQADG